MQTIEGPHGTTLLVDDPHTWAKKHAAYMKGLFRVEVAIETNRDQSLTVKPVGMDPVTFAREKAGSAPAESPAEVGSIHQPLRRYMEDANGKTRSGS